MVGYGTSADGLSYHIPHLLVDKLKLKKNDIEVFRFYQGGPVQWLLTF